jgi:hypothetical protein
VDDKDYFKWRLTKNGFSTVRSLYLHEIDTHPPQHRKIENTSKDQDFSLVSSKGGRFDKR